MRSQQGSASDPAYHGRFAYYLQDSCSGKQVGFRSFNPSQMLHCWASLLRLRAEQALRKFSKVQP